VVDLTIIGVLEDATTTGVVVLILSITVDTLTWLVVSRTTGDVMLPISTAVVEILIRVLASKVRT